MGSKQHLLLNVINTVAFIVINIIYMISKYTFQIYYLNGQTKKCEMGRQESFCKSFENLTQIYGF